MPATSDGPAWAINPPAPPPPADVPLPPKAGGLARTHCRLTGHTGDWTYPDGRCVRIRMCQRCGEITSKQEHTWSPFEYVAAARCEQERRCDRCGAAESRVQHSWGPWRYASEHDSRQATTCRRCGAETRTRPGQLW
jgi:ribosomal protein L37E